MARTTRSLLSLASLLSLLLDLPVSPRYQPRDSPAPSAVAASKYGEAEKLYREETPGARTH